MDEDGTFKKRTGTGAEHGNRYEKLLCLRLVQWLEKNKKEFEIANNVDNIGDCDDIVCKFKESDSDIYFFLQAKHAINDKKLTMEGKEKNFPLKKMFESFLKIRDYLLKTSEKNQKFELSFVTNRNVDSTLEKNLSIVTDETTSLSNVLGKSGKCYKIQNKNTNIFRNELKSEDETLVKEFLDHLKIYVEQCNNEGLEKLIKKNMHEQYSYNDSDVNTLFLKIEKRINDWYEQKDKVKCLAEKGRLFLTEQIKFYKNTLPELVKHEMLKFSDDYLAKLSDKLKKNKIICAKFKIEEMQFYTTLLLRFVSYVSSINKQNDENLLYIDESIDTSLLENVNHIKLISCCITKQNENVTKIISCLQKLSEQQNVQVFLLLEETCKVEISINPIDPFSFTQLSKNSSEYFLQKEVVFQGEVASLNDIISDDTKELIDVSMISNLCKNKNIEKIEIGEKLDLSEVKSYYIPRDFLLNNVNTFVALFKQYMVNKDVFCFVQINEDEKYTLEQQPNFKLIRNKEEFLDHVQENKDKNVHLFKNTESGVKYVETKGSPDVIDKKITKNEESYVVFSEKNFVDINFGEVSENRFICISDIPGNGKSIMLKSLSIQLKENFKSKWIVLVDLTKLKTIETVCDTPNSVIDVVVECLGYTDKTTEELFRKFCMLPHKVILLLDAYDEIISHYKERVQSFLKALKSTEIKKIIVATRQHCVNDIKKQFPVLFVFNMSPFSKRRQKEFITKYWEQELSLSKTEYKSVFVAECVDKLVQFVQNLKVEELKKITGVPLLIKIFAETYYRDVKKGTYSNSFTITDEVNNIDSIYSKFFSEKFKILYEDKYKIEDEKVLKDFKNLKTYSTLTSHTCLALREIFWEDIVSKYFEFEKMWPKKLFSKLYNQNKVEDIIDRDVPDTLGVVTKNNDKYVFIHRTFAEYFCAIKIISQIHSACDSKLIDIFNFFLGEILIKDEYIVIRKFLNENILNLNDKLFPNEKYKFFHIESNCKKNILYHLSAERLDNIYKWLKQCIRHNGNTEIFYSTLLNKKLSLVIQMGNKNKQHKKIGLYNNSNSTKHRKSLFFEALEDGYVCIVETMIENTPECVKLYWYNREMSALDYVCTNKCKREEEMIKLLLEKGAVVSNEGEHFISMPLITFINSRKSINVIELLVEKGADVNVTCKDGKTPLMYAANCNRLDIVELLITKYKIGVNMLCIKQRSALWYAVERPNIAIVQFMLDHGATAHSNTLIQAVKKYNFKITELLLEKGGDVANAIQDSDIHEIFEYIINNNYSIRKVLSRYKLSEIESLKKYATEIITLLNEKRTTTKLKEPDISMINGRISLQKKKKKRNFFQRHQPIEEV